MQGGKNRVSNKLICHPSFLFWGQLGGGGKLRKIGDDRGESGGGGKRKKCSMVKYFCKYVNLISWWYLLMEQPYLWYAVSSMVPGMSSFPNGKPVRNVWIYEACPSLKYGASCVTTGA